MFPFSLQLAELKYNFEQQKTTLFQREEEIERLKLVVLPPKQDHNSQLTQTDDVLTFPIVNQLQYKQNSRLFQVRLHLIISQITNHC